MRTNLDFCETLEYFVQNRLVRGAQVDGGSKAFGHLMKLLEPFREVIESEMKNPNVDRSDLYSSIQAIVDLPSDVIESILDTYSIRDPEVDIFHRIYRDWTRFGFHRSSGPRKDGGLEQGNISAKNIENHIEDLEELYGVLEDQLKKFKAETTKVEWRLRAVETKINEFKNELADRRDAKDLAKFHELKAKFEPEAVKSPKDLTWLCKVMGPGGFVQRELTVDQQIAYWRAGRLAGEDIGKISDRMEDERRELEKRAEAEEQAVT